MPLSWNATAMREQMARHPAFDFSFEMVPFLVCDLYSLKNCIWNQESNVMKLNKVIQVTRIRDRTISRKRLTLYSRDPNANRQWLADLPYIP